MTMKRRTFLRLTVAMLSIVWLFTVMAGSAALADGVNTGKYAVVANPVSTDRLNVRESADLNATSIAKLYNGTFVRILSVVNERWAYIEVGNDDYGDGVLTGYVHTDFLNTEIVSKSSDIATPVLTITNSQGTGINMRQEPSEKSTVLGLFQNGDQITVLAVLRDWYFVQVGGRTGYMSKIGFSVDLSRYNSSSRSSQARAKLTTGAATIAETTDVYSARYGGEKLATLQKGVSVGIISLHDTGWASITYPGNSEGGWVSYRVLSSSGSGGLSLGSATVAEQTNVLSDMFNGAVVATLAKGETVTICTVNDSGWAMVTSAGNPEGGWVQASALTQ